MEGHHFFAEAAKQDSRDPKINLQLILLFLDRSRLISQLPQAFFTAGVLEDRDPKMYLQVSRSLIPNDRGTRQPRFKTFYIAAVVFRGCRETLF